MKEFEVYTKTKTIENINLTTECGDMDSSVRWTTDTPQRLTLKDLYIFIKNDLKSLREVNLLGKAMLFYILTIRTKYE